MRTVYKLFSGAPLNVMIPAAGLGYEPMGFVVIYTSHVKSRSGHGLEQRKEKTTPFGFD